MFQTPHFHTCTDWHTMLLDWLKWAYASHNVAMASRAWSASLTPPSRAASTQFNSADWNIIWAPLKSFCLFFPSAAWIMAFGSNDSVSSTFMVSTCNKGWEYWEDIVSSKARSGSENKDVEPPCNHAMMSKSDLISRRDYGHVSMIQKSHFLSLLIATLHGSKRRAFLIILSGISRMHRRKALSPSWKK